MTEQWGNIVFFPAEASKYVPPPPWHQWYQMHSDGSMVIVGKWFTKNANLYNFKLKIRLKGKGNTLQSSGSHT